MITMTARTGTATFQITIAVFESDSSFAPNKLITVNISMAALAMRSPTPLSVPFVFSMLRFF